MIDKVAHICTGCNACRNICPVGAITIEHDADKDRVIVDSQKCVGCGKCVKICPQVNEIKDSVDMIYPRVFAVQYKDDKILKNSASGSAFFGLASYILDKSGVVYGAACDMDNHTVNIIRINEVKELSRLQGSKYVESDTGYTYKEVEKDLTEERFVLYTGLPCQIAGLRNYLYSKNINTDRLYTADLVCHGAPSSKLYADYCRHLEKEHNSRLVKFEHRNKAVKWNPLVPKFSTIQFGDKETIISSYKDDYLLGFLRGITYRESCYNCNYSRMPRISDITMADYAGLGVLQPSERKYDEGVSQILLNTSKGRELFEECQNMFSVEERLLSEALQFNLCLRKHVKKSELSEKFFSDYELHDWNYLSERYIRGSRKYNIVKTMKDILAKVIGVKLSLKLMLKVRNDTEEVKSIEEGLRRKFEG